MDVDSVPENVETFKGSTDIEKWVRKFIEYDIMDPAWFEIVRRHPEVQVDSDGKKIQLSRNHNLKKYLHVDESRPVESIVSGIATCENNAIFVDIHGTLRVCEKKSLKQKASLDIRDSLPLPHGLPPSQVLPGTFLQKKAQYHTPIPHKQSSTFLEEEKDDSHNHKVRIVYLTVDLFVEILGADTAPKKGKDKNVPVDLKPKTFMKFRVTVVDVYGNEESVSVEKICDWYLGNDNGPSFDTFDTVQSMIEDISCTLCNDGRILSIFQRDSENSQIHLFDLPPVKLSQEPLSPRASGTAPTLIAQWKTDAYIGDVQLVTIPGGSTSSPVPEHVDMTEEQRRLQRQAFYETELIILLGLANASFIPVIKLKIKPAEAPVNPKAAKAPPKGAPEVPPPPTVLCVPYEIARISLNSVQTIFTTAVVTAEQQERESKGPVNSSKKTMVLLAVGHMDGQITLWNLFDNICLSTLAQHRSLVSVARSATGEVQRIQGPAMISSLRIIPSSSFPSISNVSSTGNSSNAIMVVAGAVDGTISFHSTAGNLFDDLRVNAPNFSDFRHDVFEDAVLHMDVIKVANSPAGLCLLVHHASGLRVVYKIYRGRSLLLVGSLSLNERVDFKEIHSSFLSVMNIPRDPFLPPHELLNPPPPPEPVAPAKAAAGKGKDAAPAPEPEPEPTPEEIAAKAAEEERQKAETYRKMMLAIHTAKLSLPRCAALVRKSVPLSGLIGVGDVSVTDGLYVASIARDGGAGVALYSIDSLVVKALDSDEGLRDVLLALKKNPNNDASNNSLVGQESSLAGAPDASLLLGRSSSSVKTVSRVRSALPIQSGNTASLATLTAAGSVTSYKQVKLTEKRLHDHEQQLAETRRGFLDSFSQSALDNYGIEEEEALTVPAGPTAVHPTFAAKGEILRMKKEKLKARSGAFGKKLTTLAALCS